MPVARAKSGAQAPSYAVGKRGSFDPALSAYNLKPSNTRKLRRGLAQVAAKTGVVDWTCIGDSKTGGLNAGGNVAWPLDLRRTLAGAGYSTSGGVNYAASPALEAGWNDTRWTFTGTLSRINNACVQLQSAGATATFRSDVAGDTVDIWYFGTSAPFTYSIDGSTAVTVTPNGVYDLFKTTVGGLSKTFHTVVIGTPAPQVYLIGIDVYLAAYGLKVHNFAQAGQSSTFIDDNTDRVANGTVVRVTAPNTSVTFIALGTNDLFQGRTPTQMHDALAITIAGEKARSTAPDVVLLVETSASSPDTSWEPYVERLYALADEYDVPLLDLYALTGPNNTLVAAGVLGSDAIHETALGHQLIASHLARAFIQSGPPSPTAPNTLPAAYGELGMDAGRLAFADGKKSIQVGPRTPKFSELLVFGHSYAQLTTTGVSRLGHRWSTKLASAVGAREWNVGVNGSKILWPDVGALSGGWNTVFHALLKNRSIARAAGSGYPAEQALGAFYWGANDWPRLGTAKLSTTTAFGNTLRSCIARFRASRHFASNDASVVYATPANWTSDTSVQFGANPAASGETAKKTAVAAPGAITITTPTDTEVGCYMTIYFPVDPTSTAGSAAVTWNGVSQGSITIGGASLIDNSNDTSGGAAVTANRHGITCMRIGPVATAGAQTIVITITGAAPVTANAFGGYDIEEADPPPLLVLNSPKITTAVGYGMWRMVGTHAYQGTTDQMPTTDAGADTLWNQGNGVIASVCAEFDARVIYIDVDAAFAKNAIYWPAGDQHPNDRGNTVIAGLCYAALERLNQSLDQNQLTEVNVDTLGGDSLSDTLTGNGVKTGTVSVFGRSRSAKLYYPCAVGETPISKTLVASTAQAMTGLYYVSTSDFAEFRLRAHVTTALANARLYAEAQNVFGFLTLDFAATIARPEYGAMLLDATGQFVGAWTPLFPQLRRGDWQLRFSLYGTTAGTVAFTNAGIEFR